MKRAFLTILFFMSLLPCIVYAEELFLCISDGQWGYATDDGTVVIAASFSEATPFYNGVAKVRTSVPMDHYSLIDFQGNEITPPCYDIYEFDSAFIYAVDAGDVLLFGFYDKQSGYLSSTYDAIKLTDPYINEQEYIAVQDNDKWGFVHRSTGNVIIPCVYDEIVEPFQNGYALVIQADHQINDNFDSMDDYILINSNGVPVTFDDGIVPMSCPSSVGLIAVVQNGLYGLADIYGRLMIEPQYEYVDSPTNDRFWYQNTAGYWGVLDERGAVIVEPSFLHNDLLYGTPPAYVNDYAVVRLKDQVVILDLAGTETVINRAPNITVGNVIDEVQMLSYYDSSTDRYGFYNVYGLMLTSELYEDYSPLTNGLITVKREGKWGVLDNNGIEILPCVYDEINRFNNSTIYVIQDSTISYISISKGI